VGPRRIAPEAAAAGAAVAQAREYEAPVVRHAVRLRQAYGGQVATGTAVAAAAESSAALCRLRQGFGAQGHY
jgi:hypothetical protein